jgi:hypothetical protein
MRDDTLRLSPNLFRRAMVMRAPVRIVGILVGIEILLRLGRSQLTRLVQRAIRAFGRIGEKDLRTVRADNARALR